MAVLCCDVRHRVQLIQVVFSTFCPALSVYFSVTATVKEIAVEPLSSVRTSASRPRFPVIIVFSML